MADRWIPLVPARNGTQVARPARKRLNRTWWRPVGHSKPIGAWRDALPERRLLGQLTAFVRPPLVKHRGDLRRVVLNDEGDQVCDTLSLRLMCKP